MTHDILIVWDTLVAIVVFRDGNSRFFSYYNFEACATKLGTSVAPVLCALNK